MTFEPFEYILITAKIFMEHNTKMLIKSRRQCLVLYRLVNILVVRKNSALILST